MTEIDHITITDPAALIPMKPLRDDADRLIAETPGPPDCMIVEVAERHLGRLTDQDRESWITLFRSYSSALLAREGA